jgi:hypothetical protein
MLEDDRIAFPFVDVGHAAALHLEEFLCGEGLDADLIGHGKAPLWDLGSQNAGRPRSRSGGRSAP